MREKERKNQKGVAGQILSKLKSTLDRRGAILLLVKIVPHNDGLTQENFFLAYVHVHCGSERALPNNP